MVFNDYQTLHHLFDLGGPLRDEQHGANDTMS